MSSFNIKNIRKWMANEISCIQKVEKLITILLHPIYSGKLEEGVKTELESLVNKYSEQFDGLLLGYDSVKIYGDTGMIFDTFPYIHIEIRAKFYIFHPKVGDTIEGVVVKKSPHHVGCLVHELFNISCFIPPNTNIKEWCGSNAYEGNTLKIKVTDRDMKSMVPYFKGSIEAVSSSGNQSSNENKHKYFKEDDLNCGEPDLISTNKPQQNCKKKTFLVEETNKISCTNSSDSNEITPAAKKLKKSKKNKLNLVNIKKEKETSSEETFENHCETEKITKTKKKKNKDIQSNKTTKIKKKNNETLNMNLLNKIKIKKERSSNEDSDSNCLDQSAKIKIAKHCKKKIKIEM